MVSVLCESVHIQEGRMERKELLDVEAFLDGRDLYIGPGSQWKVKGKDIVLVEVINDFEVLIETKKKLKFHLAHQQSPSHDQTRKWKSFQCRLRDLFERNASLEGQKFPDFLQKSNRHALGRRCPAKRPTSFQPNLSSRSLSPVVSENTSSRRERGKFGKRGTDSTIHLSSANKSRSLLVNDTSRAVDSAPKRKHIVPVDPSFSSDGEENGDGSGDEQLLQDNPSHDIAQMKSETEVDDDNIVKNTHESKEGQSNNRRKMVRLRKIKSEQREDNDDSDDEDLFSTNTSDLATPANQRVVLTNVVTNTHSTARNQNKILTEGAKLDEVSERKSQSSITSFFSTQTKADSSQPTIPNTPAKQAIFSPSTQSARCARTFTTTITASATKAHRAMDNSGWLQSSPARNARSPQEKRRKELLGPHLDIPTNETTRRKTNNDDVLRNDPIGEFSSPPRKLIKTGQQLPQTSIRRRVVPTLINRFANSNESISSYSSSVHETDIPQPSTQSIDGLRLMRKLDMGPTTPVYRKFRGLRNLGNTCYQNASLQLLYTCRDLITALQERTSKGPLTNSICNIAKDLSQQYLPPVNSRIIKDAMDTKTDKYVGYEQRDAHEFLSDLVDFIHDELEDEGKSKSENTKSIRLPTDDFCMKVRVCLQCCSCGYTRNKEEMYRHLSIDIIKDPDASTDNAPEGVPVPKVTVDTSLAHFFQPETREIKCEKCADGSHAQQTLRILSPPKLLLLHLKRFIVVEREISPMSSEIDVENHAPNSPSTTFTLPPQVEYILRKNKAPVAIPSSLSLDPFTTSVEVEYSDSEDISTSQAHNTLQESNFALQSIVHHIGSRASSGHYTADAVRIAETNVSDETDKLVSDVSSNELWVSFDDGISTETSLEKILQNSFKQSTAYMLLYRLK